MPLLTKNSKAEQSGRQQTGTSGTLREMKLPFILNVSYSPPARSPSLFFPFFGSVTKPSPDSPQVGSTHEYSFGLFTRVLRYPSETRPVFAESGTLFSLPTDFQKLSAPSGSFQHRCFQIISQKVPSKQQILGRLCRVWVHNLFSTVN